jgi:undecaprenyl diphosphate synthase
MKLLKTYFKKFIKKVIDKGVRLRVIGGRSELSADLIKVIEKGEKESQENKTFNLNIAINYGGRQEIVSAVNKLIEKGEEITVNSISSNLMANGSPKDLECSNTFSFKTIKQRSYSIQ